MLTPELERALKAGPLRRPLYLIEALGRDGAHRVVG